HQRRAVPDVHERDLLVAHRPSLFWLQPGGYEPHRLLRRLPVRRLRAALGKAARHQGNAELRTRGRPARLSRLGGKAGSPPVLTLSARRRSCSATNCAAVNPPLTTERANRISQPAKSSRLCGDNRDCRSTARSDAPPWPLAHGVRAFPDGADHRLAGGTGQTHSNLTR